MTGIGINADAKFLGNPDAFYGYAKECDSMTIIDDDKYEVTHTMHAENPTMTICRRKHFPGQWEGRWRDCEHDGGKKYDDLYMYQQLTTDYRPEYNSWIYFGNEPARPQNLLKEDIEFYCKTVQRCIDNNVRVCVMNIQIVELTAETISYYKPLFQLCHSYPDLVAFGIHQYFLLLLALGVGTGDWTKLVKWGSFPKSQWATPQQAQENAAFAHIGKDFWLRKRLDDWGFTHTRLFTTECGYDLINNLPQVQELTNANNGRKPRGLQTLWNLYSRHFPNQDPVEMAADNMIWMGDTCVSSENLMFYNWSIEPEWWDYSCSEYPEWRKFIVKYNREKRALAQPIEIVRPPVVTPPVIIQPTNRYTQAEILALQAEKQLNPNGLIARLAQDAHL